MAFRLTFLGTSAGIPTKNRYVSGLAIELMLGRHRESHHCPWVLVDCGDGIQYQLLKTPLKLSKLVAICITHLHGDHCYGLAALLATLSMQNRREPLTIIAPRPLAKLLDCYSLVSGLYFDYPIDFLAIEDYIGGDQAVTLALNDKHTLDIDITALSHRIDSYAFGFNQQWREKRLDTEQLADLGVQAYQFRQYKADPKYCKCTTTQSRLVVAGDNDKPELLAQATTGAIALVHEATYTQAVLDGIRAKGIDPKHSSAKQVATFAQTQQLPTLILTHFSGRYAPFDDVNHKKLNMGHIKAEAMAYYQGRLILAKDLMTLTLA